MAMPSPIKIVIEAPNATHNLKGGEYFLDTEHNILFLCKYPSLGDGILPAGDIYIEENGTFDVYFFENAIVNVPNGATGRGKIEYTVTGDSNVEWGGPQALGALCAMINPAKVSDKAVLVITGNLPDRDNQPYYYNNPVFYLAGKSEYNGIYSYGFTCPNWTAELVHNAVMTILSISLSTDTSQSYPAHVLTSAIVANITSPGVTTLDNKASCPPGTKFTLYY